MERSSESTEHELLEQLSAMLRAKAATCVAGGRDARLAMLAHIFAVCELLRERRPGFRVYGALVEGRGSMSASTASWRPAVHGWDDLETALAEVDLDDASTALRDLLALLVQLEADFAGAVEREGALLPEETLLDPVDPVRPILIGSVRHWARHPPRLRRIFDGQPIPKRAPMSYRFTVADQLDHLGMVWDRRTWPVVRPAPRTNRRRIVHRIVSESAARLEAGRFRIALCPVVCEAWTRFRVDPPSSSFAMCRHRPISSPTALAAHLEELLRDCARADVDILALPELTVDADAQTVLREILRRDGSVPLTVAGSRHLEGAAGRQNEALVVDDRGAPVFRHWKRGRFRVRGTEVLASIASGADVFEIDPPGTVEADSSIEEGIEGGTELWVLDATIGRIGVVVCADVLDPIAGDAHAIERAGLDLLLVVSMTPKTQPFEAFAARMTHVQTAMFFVNAACVSGGPGGDEVAALAWLPMAAGRLPTRVRWQLGRLEVESYDGKIWSPIAADRYAIEILPEGRGIVVNLGAYWKNAIDLPSQ